MSAGAAGATGACAGCLRRSWLLGQLIVPLDYRARDRTRLLAALELDDRELLAALAGRRRRELDAAWQSGPANALELPDGVETICCHGACYPARLRAGAAPPTLFVQGGTRRLSGLARGPLVTVLGAKRASDHGAEVAASLARELTASGVAVAAPLAAGVAAAALGSVQALGAPAIAVRADGLGASGARARSLQRSAAQRGCVISELPPGIRGRRFGDLAAERTLARLGDVVLVVEATADASEVATARTLIDEQVPVAAVPGRVTSPLAGGPNALIRAGAMLVRYGADVLEMLPAGGAREAEERTASRTLRVPSAALSPTSSRRSSGALPRPPAPLPAALAAVLERVADGCDTVARLCAEGCLRDDTLLALSELEVMGLLGRGAGGRYFVRATPRN